MTEQGSLETAGRAGASWATTALVLMDLQRPIVEMIDGGVVVGRLARVLAAAREAGVHVIHVKLGFAPGYRDLDPANRIFEAIRSSARFVGDADEDGVVPELAPLPDEVVVTKKRVSAFVASPLEATLRSSRISHVVLAGLSTSGVVLSTLRHAADLDFAISVLSDGCADRDAEVHRVLVEKVFPRQADVLTCEEWITSLAGDAARRGG
jgi:nicotinamidase-related amidase